MGRWTLMKRAERFGATFSRLIDAPDPFRYAMGKFDVQGRSPTVTGRRLFRYVGRVAGDRGL